MTGRVIEVTEAARQWTECLEQFKVVTSAMYDVCLESQSLAGCREALIYLSNATRDFESLIGMINVEQAWPNEGRQHAVAWEVKGSSAIARTTPTIEEVWQVVAGSRKRRNTASSCSSDESRDPKLTATRKTSVYERLAYNIRRPPKPVSPEVPDTTSPPGSNLMCPRSAMDLPQTKASMAKMAYSRERLWKDRVLPLLEERQRRHSAASSKQRPTYSQVAKKPVKKSDVLKEINRSREPSLASISETAEAEDDKLSTETMAVAIESRQILAELEDDNEWQAMTAEEESLAQEQESLQKEILEEERSSVDEEFERLAKQKFGKTGGRYRKSWKEIVANWAKKIEKLDDSKNTTSDVCYRKPGEVAQMHEKLLSPSRRRPQNDVEKRLEERQQKALELRQRLLDEKAKRLKELHTKVEEVQGKRLELELKKRAMLEAKMEKAESNRQRNLAEVVEKAKVDDLRIQEIKLIQKLETLSRRGEIKEREQKAKENLVRLAEQQAKRVEQAAAKHAHAEESRNARQQKYVEKLQEQTERIEERFKLKQELLEEAKLKAREKERSRNASDSDGFVFPAPSEWGLMCDACNAKITSNLHAEIHVTTPTHITSTSTPLPDDLTVSFVRSQLESHIVPATEEIAPTLTDVISSTTFAKTVDLAALKKKRQKIRQKIINSSATALSLADSDRIPDKELYRLVKEVEGMIGRSTAINKIEKVVNEVIKKVGGAEVVRGVPLAVPGIFLRFLDEPVFEISSSQNDRVYGKVLFLVGTLLESQKLQKEALKTNFIFQLSESFIKATQAKSVHRSMGQFHVWLGLYRSGRYDRGEGEDVERYRSLATYLLYSGVGEWISEVIDLATGQHPLDVQQVSGQVSQNSGILAARVLSSLLQVKSDVKESQILVKKIVIQVVKHLHRLVVKSKNGKENQAENEELIFTFLQILTLWTTDFYDKKSWIEEALVTEDNLVVGQLTVVLTTLFKQKGAEKEKLTKTALVKIVTAVAFASPTAARLFVHRGGDSVLATMLKHAFSLYSPGFEVIFAALLVTKKSSMAIDIVNNFLDISWFRLLLKDLIAKQIPNDPKLSKDPLKKEVGPLSMETMLKKEELIELKAFYDTLPSLP